MVTSRLWAIVLAGGEGTRLAPLTRALYREEIPKQFARLDGDRSLLQTTLLRVAPLVAPTQTIVVVGSGHESRAREQIKDSVELLVQPQSLDTAPAVLAALARISTRDPNARVAVFPSDHHVERPEPLLEAVDRGSRVHGRVTLVGVTPEYAETEYGWIVAGARVRAGLHAVRRFVEKPRETIANRMLAQGALWNTFVSCGPAAAWRALFRAHLPIHARTLVGDLDADGLSTRYARLPPASLSRDVLQKADGLCVAPVDDVGWSDWGTPARVFRSLEGTPQLASLVARMT